LTTLYPFIAFSKREAFRNPNKDRIRSSSEAEDTIRRLKRKRKRDELTEAGLERLDRLEERLGRLYTKDTLEFEVTGKNKFKFTLINSPIDQLIPTSTHYLNLRRQKDGITTITPLVELSLSTDDYVKEKNLRVRGADFTGDQVDIIVTSSFSPFDPISELTVNIA
tara:strand:- start:437 stop:934 length:498 start_codon:yes stop_codon:yes gene_type:complete